MPTAYRVLRHIHQIAADEELEGRNTTSSPQTTTSPSMEQRSPARGEPAVAWSQQAALATPGTAEGVAKEWRQG